MAKFTSILFAKMQKGILLNSFKKGQFNFMRKYIFYLLGLFSFGCNSENQIEHKPDLEKLKETISINIPYYLKSKIKHDTNSFTEGLVFKESILYESTGSPEELPKSKSVVGPVNIASGKIAERVRLNSYFGEGITFINNRLYFLTYKERKAFVYDANTFKQIDSFVFQSNEGWGLTNDGINLIMSDGTNKLTYINPYSYKVVKILNVTENGLQVNNLNELEYIDHYIYANIFTTSRIIKIDPQSGNVIGYLNLTSIEDDARKDYSGSLEMNGIAYDSVSKKIMVTGKMWASIYEIEFHK